MWPATPPPSFSRTSPNGRSISSWSGDHAVERHAELAARGAGRVAGLVHERLRQQDRDVGPAGADPALGDQAAVLLLRLRQLPAARELRGDLEADVVAGLRVAGTRVAETRRQEIRHVLSFASGRAGLRARRRRRYSPVVGIAGVAASPAVLGTGILALGGLLALLADELRLLLELGLGLLLDPRRREGRDRDLVGVLVLAEDELDALGRLDRAELKRVVDVHPGDVGGDRLGDLGRQRLDRELVGDVLEHAALLDAGGVVAAEQLDRDLGLDLDVELDLLEVEVDELAADRVALLFLDHDRDRSRALDIDVDQRAAVKQDVAGVALGDLERPRVVAGGVDDAGDEAVAAQAPALARAELGSRLSLQCRSVGGHAAAEDREPLRGSPRRFRFPSEGHDDSGLRGWVRTQWVALLALFIALATGTAYAANTVFSTDIVDGQVRTVDLANGAVAVEKIADGSITGDKIKDGAIQGRDVLDNSLKGADIDESTLSGSAGAGARHRRPRTRSDTTRSARCRWRRPFAEQGRHAPVFGSRARGSEGTGTSIKEGYIGMRVQRRRRLRRGSPTVYTNERNSHKPFVSAPAVVKNLPAGAHTIRLETVYNAASATRPPRPSRSTAPTPTPTTSSTSRSSRYPTRDARPGVPCAGAGRRPQDPEGAGDPLGEARHGARRPGREVRGDEGGVARPLGGGQSAEKLEARHLETALKMVSTLGEMKGAAMKIGQLASFIDTEFLPPEYAELYQEELAKLRTSAPPMPWKEVEKVVTRGVRRAGLRPLHRVRAGGVRGRLDRPGAPGDAQRRPRGRGQDPVPRRRRGARVGHAKRRHARPAREGARPGPRREGGRRGAQGAGDGGARLRVRGPEPALVLARLPRPPVHLRARRDHAALAAQGAGHRVRRGDRLRRGEEARPTTSAAGSARSSSASASARSTTCSTSTPTPTPATTS